MTNYHAEKVSQTLLGRSFFCLVWTQKPLQFRFWFGTRSQTVTKHIGSIVCLVWSQQTATPEFVTPFWILEGCTWPICRSAAAWTNIALKYWVNITIVVFRSPRRLNTEIYFLLISFVMKGYVNKILLTEQSKVLVLTWAFCILFVC